MVLIQIILALNQMYLKALFSAFCYFLFTSMTLKETLFADDTMLFSLVSERGIPANDLNNDLDTMCEWGDQWKVEFNPDPTKQATEVLFSCKESAPYHPQLTFN